MVRQMTAGLSCESGAAPVWGCVLIGGKSSRMGSPKHLLRRDGLTWLELIVQQFQGQVEQVVLVGQGEIPPSLAGLPVVADVPGLQGPLAGVLAVFRQQPRVSWLVAACDLPCLERSALEWLLGCRGPGVRAVLPDLMGDGQVEPLLAYYDCSCRDLLEEVAAGGANRLSGLVGRTGVITPRPPASLQGSWRNVNRPEDIGWLL
jgi:molybdopterin-guanine dinucleotide biosynthesis protein A